MPEECDDCPFAGCVQCPCGITAAGARMADYLPLIRQCIHRRRDPVEAVRGSGEDAGLFDLLGGEGA